MKIQVSEHDKYHFPFLAINRSIIINNESQMPVHALHSYL